MHSSLLRMEWLDVELNVIDAPGSPDFIGASLGLALPLPPPLPPPQRSPRPQPWQPPDGFAAIS